MYFEVQPVGAIENGHWLMKIVNGLITCLSLVNDSKILLFNSKEMSSRCQRITNSTLNRQVVSDRVEIASDIGGIIFN